MKRAYQFHSLGSQRDSGESTEGCRRKSLTPGTHGDRGRGGRHMVVESLPTPRVHGSRHQTDGRGPSRRTRLTSFLLPSHRWNRFECRGPDRKHRDVGLGSTHVYSRHTSTKTTPDQDVWVPEGVVSPGEDFTLFSNVLVRRDP